MAKLKHFYENVNKSIDKEGDAAQFNQNFNQPDEKRLQTSVTFLIKRKVKDPSPGQKQN